MSDIQPGQRVALSLESPSELLWARATARNEAPPRQDPNPDNPYDPLWQKGPAHGQ